MMTQDIVKFLHIEDKNFIDCEESIYRKYEEQAEYEIIEKLSEYLSNPLFLLLLKNICGGYGYRFDGYRKVGIRLRSGKKWQVFSPVFIKRHPRKKKKSRSKRERVTRHFGLELLGIINHMTPGLLQVCVSMATLCPSFKVAVNALKNFGVTISQSILQSLTYRFAELGMEVRTECHFEDIWQKPGNRILICIDGGRYRERSKKKGRMKKGQKRRGYHANWVEPKQLTISLFDDKGKKISNISPIIDGTAAVHINTFFELLKEHILQINTKEASEIVFCADGGNGLWPRIDKLIEELKLNNAERVLDYTHAKQNIHTIIGTISQALKLSEKEKVKLSSQIKEMLWNGDIKKISNFVLENLGYRRKAYKTCMDKLNGYFADHSKFQYKLFRERGLPIGSGSVESAIRRVINLRIKGPGIFWIRQNAEKMIFLRSLVLTGKLKNAYLKILDPLRMPLNINNLAIA